jgi:hypothetical protein
MFKPSCFWRVLGSERQIRKYDAVGGVYKGTLKGRCQRPQVLIGLQFETAKHTVGARAPLYRNNGLAERICA